MAEYYYDKGIRKKVKEGYTISSKGTIVKASKKKKKKEEDIAPVKKTTGGNKNSWFKSGGFSDGVDGVGDFFGDLIETTVGTVGDAVVGVGKGVTRLGEGIVDLGAYGAAGVADAIGKDKWADKTRKKAQKDWTSNAWKSAEEKFDKNSILGNKADAVTEGIGQVGGIILTGGIAGALGAGGAAATAITTGVTGLSGMGSGMSEAYRNKATDKEAFTYGAIAGTAEAATELLFGGLGKTVKAIGLSKGLSSADDMLAKKITSKFTNQIAKNFTEFGIKAGAEGTEEVLSGIAQAVGKKVTYMEEKELEELIKDENLLDQFIVGSITSGIAQSGYVPGMTQGSLREANKTGTDFISGLTQNEQKVVDKEYENRIAEAEESGDKLSKKEKNKIYDEVVDDLEKGRISIDTIESAIGGETYKTYKNMDEQENAIRKQIEELENTPFSQITVKQQEKLTELRKQLETMEKSGLKNKVKAQLSNEVSELALSSKLSESYNERTRKSQAFKADLTKYDTKQQEVIKKATESGILNNTNRTHEFVDMVAKISADKGVSFDFTNNQKLKDSGFAVEGKTVNGYVKDGNVAVNIDSNKSLNSVVGHEITHVLEGTELYTELQNAVKEYATTKGEYDTRFNELSELYKDVEGSNIESELTADLVGDYLFTDSDFINNLSTKKPNIFQKIYNEIKYLCKIATAGSKEARQLEKVKRAFDKAYKESASNNTDTKTDTKEDTNKKYSLSENEKERLNKVTDDGLTMTYVRNPNSGASKYNYGSTYGQNIEPAGEYMNMDESQGKYKNEGWEYGTIRFKKPLVLEHINTSDTGWKKTVSDMYGGKTGKALTKALIKDGYDAIVTYDKYGYNEIVNLNGEKLNDSDSTKNVQSDSNGKELTKEQQEYFKDSKVRDENGNLKVMYHGTPNGDYTVFRDGTYFTESKDYADRYQSPSASSISTGKVASNPKTFEVYLNIKKPFDISDPEAKDIYINEYIKGGNAMGINPYMSDSEYAKIDTIDWTEGEDLREFLIDNEYDYDGLILDEGADGGYGDEVSYRGKSYVVFNPEQIKNIDNTNPTEDADIRHSLSDKRQNIAPYGKYNVYGKDVALEKDILSTPTVQEKPNVVQYDIQDDIAPTQEVEEETTDDDFEKIVQSYIDDAPPFLIDDEEVRAWAEEQARENPQGVTQKESTVTPESPLDADRDIYTIGKERKRNAYMYENPEVKPFFQDEARTMLWELQNSTRGKKERMDIDAPSEEGWYGTHRHTSDEIAYLLDTFKYKYNDITKGLMAIIDDHGAENNAVSKRIEFLLDDRLRLGYTVFTSGQKMPPNEHYIELLNKKQVTEYNEEARSKYFQPEVETVQDIAPVKEIAAEPVTTTNENVQPQVNEKQVTSKLDNGAKQRKWVKTSTESKPVDRKILPKDLEQKAITYEPIPNKVTLNSANEMLKRNGYDESVKYFNSQFQNKKVSLDDIALGERLIQEAVKKGDMVTAGELIQNVSILGTELGQKVQALSIIQRLTPEGQLKTLTKIVERGKTKGDKVFEGVEITQEMIDKVLKTYRKDGTYSQEELDRAVEEVKQQIADQMKVTKMDKINSWRYLSMLGNPKTHVRNIISNVGMKGTMAVKDAIARTIETVAPVKTRTKTWKKVSDDVKEFAKQTTKEMQSILEDGGKYSDTNDIKSKRQIFKNKVLNAVFEFNNDMLSKEDWWFQSAAFNKAFSEYLTANGINTKEDIQNNAELIEKAKAYATEQSEIATFKQYSYIAHKLNEIESKNTATQIGVGAIVPFKKTPVNIAKAGLNYSPLGFMKTLTYDASQVKKGNMEASQMIDHLAQNMTGTGLALAGYMLAMSGFLNGAGEEDKEGKFDYQLGKQSYSVNIGGNTYSLSWLTPMAMPLFVGANAFEILTEGKEWDGNVVIESLTQTLDPMSEMSVLSGLTNVLSSYKSGSGIWADIAQTTGQNYVTQFVPTLSSQVATLMDDKQRSTKVAGNSDFKYLEETVNKLKSKIPGLRETLEPSTDIWGREVKLNENKWQKVFDTFLAPYSRKENIATQIDEELKDLYSDTGDGGLFPQTPKNSVNYEGEKYNMSAKEYTSFKKTYGQNALELMEELFQTTTYQNATASDKAEMVDKVYDYANDEAKRKYLAKQDVEFTNAKKDGEAYYKENIIKGAIENDMPLMEFDFYNEYPEKYNFLQKNNVSYEEYSKDEDTREAYNWAFNNPEKYTLSKAISKDVVAYRGITKGLYKIRADKDSNGKTIVGSAKEKKINYINSLDIDNGEKLVLFKSEYNADDTYNYEIIDYLNSREDITYEETETILKQLGFTVAANGNIYWD